MKLVFHATVASLLCLWSGTPVWAAAVPAALKTTLQSRLGPNIKIKGIVPSPIAGLYEVNLGKTIVYSDAQGAHFLIGKLVNAKTLEDLTDARLAELNRIDFKRLPLGNAIKRVQGNGSRKIVVFSDPNCKYCHQLEQTLKQVDDVTVYTFLDPILSPDSKDKAKAIWCSANRSQAWQVWMLDKKAPRAAKAQCNTDAIEKNIALGHTLNVTGTPTTFFANGHRLTGAIPLEKLHKELSTAR